MDRAKTKFRRGYEKTINTISLFVVEAVMWRQKIFCTGALSVMLFMFWAGGSAYASSQITVVVKTLLASNRSNQVDEHCKPLIQDLQSVFRYTSYRFLSECKMNLSIGGASQTALPGNRMMHISAIEKNAGRIKLKLELFKDGQSTFQTVVQLLNGAALTVGGPEYQDGVLLFNISGSF